MAERSEEDGDDDYSATIVNEMRVPGEYTVQVRVRIAEVRRSMLRRWGMNINVLFNDARHVITSSMGAVPTLSGVFENGEIWVLVDALNQNGSARVLEDATVVTMSGEPAAFLSGGIRGSDHDSRRRGGRGGDDQRFRGFGTSVIATPTVVDDDLIRMQIIPELSSINSGNSVNGIFGLNVRRVQTRSSSAKGSRSSLGGLVRPARTGREQPIPCWVKSRSRLAVSTRAALTEDEIELLIIVTPEDRPADGRPTRSRRSPVSMWTCIPDDIDFACFNRIEGQPDLSNYQLPPFGNGNARDMEPWGTTSTQPNPQNPARCRRPLRGP